MDANKTMRARFLSLNDMQGPVFIQNGGNMNNFININNNFINFNNNINNGSSGSTGKYTVKNCLVL